jgi:hypothetical protein
MVRHIHGRFLLTQGQLNLTLDLTHFNGTFESGPVRTAIIVFVPLVVSIPMVIGRKIQEVTSHRTITTMSPMIS